MEHEPPFAHVFVCAWGIVYLLPSEHGIDGFRRLLENRWGQELRTYDVYFPNSLWPKVKTQTQIDIPFRYLKKLSLGFELLFYDSFIWRPVPQ